MSYKTIQDHFWSDPKITALSYRERYLFLYLITNPYSHYSGIYHIREQIIIEETGMSINEVKQGLYGLSNNQLILSDPAFSVVWVINMLRHQVPIRTGVSDKILRGAANHLKTLHSCPLIKEFLDYYVEFQIPYVYEKPDAPPFNREGGEPKIIPDTTHRDQAKEIFAYWQTVMNHPDAKYSDGRRVKIENRLQAGYTVERIKKAIDNCSKSPHHMGDNDSKTVYDAIELICRNDEKLEWFINLVRDVPIGEPTPPARYRDQDGTIREWNVNTKAWEKVSGEEQDGPGSEG